MKRNKAPTFVWVFEANRRVYPPGKDISAGPIYREHWVKRLITGSTARSWVDSLGHKYPKATWNDGRDTRRDGYLWTDEEMELDVWAKAHRYGLTNFLQNATAAELAEVAQAIDYYVQPPTRDTFGL